MKRYYVGLATTFHDSALAIVGPDGEILFAEASERYLQYKRAFNCEADNFVRIPRILKDYCDPDAEYVFATTWSDHLVGMLDSLSGSGDFAFEKIREASVEFNRSLVKDYSHLAFLAYLHAAQH